MRVAFFPEARSLVLAFCLMSYAIPAAAIDSAVAQRTPDPLFDEEFDALGGNGLVADPLEPANRVTFFLNEAIDLVLWNPLSQVYRFAVPRPARSGIRRVFLNLTSPSILINKILQLRFGGAAQVFGRFVLNSTAGWGGIFDPARTVGWERQSADFGETLAMAGIPTGPYLVLPFFGPSSIRDGVGTIVDQFFQPTLYFLGPMPHIFLGTGFGFTLREEHADKLRLLKESSIDYYSVIRSAYWQDREAVIRQSLAGEADGD